MWWTSLSSRSNAAIVHVNHAYGVAQISTNQQTNGGQWNSLGQFYFNGLGKVTILAPDAYPTSYCADAVKFVKTKTVPVTAEFTADVTSGIAPLMVSFTDQSSEDGLIVSWNGF